MSKVFPLSLAGAIAGVLLALPAPGEAVAGPVSVVADTVLSSATSTGISDILYKRPVRRRGNVGSVAVLGLFGAVLGGVIASQNYNNYSTYAYGQPQEYGYAPGYVAGPVYRSGRRGAIASSRGNRGSGFPARGAVGARGAGSKFGKR